MNINFYKNEEFWENLEISENENVIEKIGKFFVENAGMNPTESNWREKIVNGEEATFIAYYDWSYWTIKFDKKNLVNFNKKA